MALPARYFYSYVSLSERPSLPISPSASLPSILHLASTTGTMHVTLYILSISHTEIQTLERVESLLSCFLAPHRPLTVASTGKHWTSRWWIKKSNAYALFWFSSLRNFHLTRVLAPIQTLLSQRNSESQTPFLAHPTRVAAILTIVLASHSLLEVEASWDHHTPGGLE